MNTISNTPEPPYYAVIFTSVRTGHDDGYHETSENMFRLASEQPGFLGIESAREDIGITVSYWKDLESIKNWKANIEHQKAQRLGREKWYSAYRVRVSKVEKDYSISKI